MQIFPVPSASQALRIDLSGSVQKRKTYRGNSYVEERLKIKRMGKTAFSIGKENLDLRYVEQLVDEEQTQTLAYLLRYAKENYGDKNADITSIVKALDNILKTKGLAGICNKYQRPDKNPSE